jgi:hypothetical protein
MDLIQMPRQFGKSTHIVQLMARVPDSVCICYDEGAIDHMVGLLYSALHDIDPASVLGKIPKNFRGRFFTPEGWFSTPRPRVGVVYVDDIDLVLGRTFSVEINAATYSPPQRTAFYEWVDGKRP